MLRYILFALLSAGLSYSHNLPELTTDEFETQIKQKQFMLIMFYAPWCGHCKRFKPEFMSAGEKLEANSNIGLGLVDCTTQEKICTRFQVSGYPTLKLFKDGKFVHDYDGARDESGVMEYALTRSQPSSKELKSQAELNELLASAIALDTPVIVSFFNSKTDASLDVHLKVAEDLLGLVSFAHTHDANIFEESPNANLIRLYRPKNLVNKLTEPFINYDGKYNADDLNSWIRKNGHGLVGYRVQKNLKLFPMDNILLFYNNVSLDKHQKGVNYYRSRIMRAVKDSGIDTSSFAFAYCPSNEFFQETYEIQAEEKEYPLVILKAAGRKYKLEKYDFEALVKFLKSFKAGTLEPFIKSEPVPINQEDAVVKVVALSFDKVVNDPNKDVLVMFHAPWCGHCKQLMPKFKSVAEKLKNEPGLTMAIFDATANEVPSPYVVNGYPTLYFVPKSSKTSPKQYQGAREEEDLIKYLSKECTDELQAYDRDGNLKKTDL